MGVFVKGMYLPPNCCFCPMTNDGFYLCKANNPHKQLEDDCEERRPNWCPLIEVSEPHGRLIDADALRAKMYHEAFETDTPMQKWDSGCWIRYKMFEDMEESAPTVIPESKEG